MFFGDQIKRNTAINAFMPEINVESGGLQNKDQPDKLIGLAGIMGTGVNL